MTAMHAAGFASLPISESRRDGLTLRDAWITAAVRCAPPDNKPTPQEFDACLPFLEREWAALARVRVVVTLGKLAWDATWRVLAGRGPRAAAAPGVRPRGQRPVATGRTAGPRRLPPQPAEHLHGPAHARRCWRASSTTPAPPSADAASIPHAPAGECRAGAGGRALVRFAGRGASDRPLDSGTDDRVRPAAGRGRDLPPGPAGRAAGAHAHARRARRGWTTGHGRADIGPVPGLGVLRHPRAAPHQRPRRLCTDGRSPCRRAVGAGDNRANRRRARRGAAARRGRRRDTAAPGRRDERAGRRPRRRRGRARRTRRIGRPGRGHTAAHADLGRAPHRSARVAEPGQQRRPAARRARRGDRRDQQAPGGGRASRGTGAAARLHRPVAAGRHRGRGAWLERSRHRGRRRRRGGSRALPRGAARPPAAGRPLHAVRPRRASTRPNRAWCSSWPPRHPPIGHSNS